MNFAQDNIGKVVRHGLSISVIALFIFAFTTTVYSSSNMPTSGTQISAKELLNEADKLNKTGSRQKATILYQQALSLYVDADETYHAAVARHELAFNYVALGEHELAIPLFEENIQFHRQRKDDNATANYLLYAAQSYKKVANIPMALDYLSKAMEMKINDDKKIAEIISLQSELLESVGSLNDALIILKHGHDILPESVWKDQLAKHFNRLSLETDDPPRLNETAEVKIQRWVVVGISILVIISVAAITLLRRWAPEILLATLSIVVSLLLGELFLRLMYPDPPQIYYLLHQPNQVRVFHPLAYIMPGVEYDESRFTTNNIGLRGDSLPSEKAFRILAVGGSSTEALFLDDSDAWPLLIQKRLSTLTGHDIWVGNAGKSGLNSFSHVSQIYQSAREIKPDLILVTAGINDLNQCISGGRLTVRNKHRTFDNPIYIKKNSEHVFTLIKPDDNRDNNSPRIIELIKQLWARQSDEATPNIPYDYVVQDDSGLFYEEQRRRRQISEKVDAVPNITDCLDAFEANLNRMVKISRDLSIQLVFITQGSLYRRDLDQYELDLLWFGSVDKNPFADDPPRHYYSAAVMETLLSTYNGRTLKVCREQGLKCWDTDSHLNKTTANYYDDVHMNVHGSHVLGDKLAGFLFSEVISKDYF